MKKNILNSAFKIILLCSTSITSIIHPAKRPVIYEKAAEYSETISAKYKEITDSENAIAAAKATQDVKQRDLETKRKELLDKKAEYDAARESLFTPKAKADALQVEVQKLTNEFASITESIKQLQDTIEQQKLHIEQTQTSINQLQSSFVDSVGKNPNKLNALQIVAEIERVRQIDIAISLEIEKYNELQQKYNDLFSKTFEQEMLLKQSLANEKDAAKQAEINKQLTDLAILTFEQSTELSAEFQELNKEFKNLIKNRAPQLPDLPAALTRPEITTLYQKWLEKNSKSVTNSVIGSKIPEINPEGSPVNETQITEAKKIGGAVGKEVVNTPQSLFKKIYTAIEKKLTQLGLRIDALIKDPKRKAELNKKSLNEYETTAEGKSEFTELVADAQEYAQLLFKDAGWEKIKNIVTQSVASSNPASSNLPGSFLDGIIEAGMTADWMYKIISGEEQPYAIINLSIDDAKFKSQKDILQLIEAELIKTTEPLKKAALDKLKKNILTNKIGVDRSINFAIEILRAVNVELTAIARRGYANRFQELKEAFESVGS